MRAAILSIGDELTLGQARDTNSSWLSEKLAEAAIIVDEHRTVADDRAAIAGAIRDLAGDRDLVIATGGLGPTRDDLTREALGDVFTPGEGLVEDPLAGEWLDDWFANQGREMPASNLRQVLRPRTMECIRNAHGTAPGLVGTLGRCTVYSLPGPPREMWPMFSSQIAPNVSQVSKGAVLLTGKVNLFGMGESLAAERLGEMLDRGRTPLIGITESRSIISARVRARGAAVLARPQVESALEEIERRWQPYAFSRGEETLPEVLLNLMRGRGLTLATAESCTGGWLGKAIVDVGGSSAYYVGGWVAYSNQMKTSCLGVGRELIAEHGAVSREVAQAMAEGARIRAGADVALSITGIAGPDRDPVSAKPVGLVYIALAHADGETEIRLFEFPGDRTAVRDRSVKAALQMLRFALLGFRGTKLLWEREL